LKISKEGYVPTYDDVLPELERIVSPLEYAWGVAYHLTKVKNTNELLRAYEENQPIVVTIMNKMSQSRPLFNAISTIDEQWKKDGTNNTNDFFMSQKVRAIANKVLSMKLGRVSLDAEAKNRFNKIELRLSEISLSFRNNILHSTNAFHFDIENADDVTNVPPSVKALWANNYAIAVSTLENKVQVVADPENGPWHITLDGPSYNEAMAQMPNRNIREKVYRASHTRASEFAENDGGSDKNNVAYIYDMLGLKKDRGRMLGFNSTAEMSIATKMVSSVESVIDFLEMILEKALPAALREFEEITLLLVQTEEINTPRRISRGSCLGTSHSGANA
jgi:oligopeptidase A